MPKVELELERCKYIEYYLHEYLKLKNKATLPIMQGGEDIISWLALREAIINAV